MLDRRAVLAGVVAASFTLGALTAPSPAGARPEAALAIPQRQLDHAEQRIHALEQRRAYLHRYIRHLRARLHAPIATATTTTASATASSTSSSSYSGSSNSGCLSDAAIASYARGAGFPESVISEMVYIAAHRNGTGESGGCPGAINSSSGACGLWQLYPCYGGSAWLDPATNAAQAYQKYKDAGYSLSPWGG